MLELQNRTPFAAAIVPGLDREGKEFVTVVIKGTFGLDPERRDAGPLALEEEQLAPVQADQFHGEPDSSSILYESEVGPAKCGTDVVLVGHAYPARGAASEVEVSLEAGSLSKTVRVFGDRWWKKTLGVTRHSSPEPFEKMPLIYERAFGGCDVSHPKPAKHAYEERNPVGTGYTTAGRGDHFDELAMPNLEDPAKLIGSPGDKPTPAGFGFIGRHWEPRKTLAGTYDDAWQNDRCPLLPTDFDTRHFRSAHPDLCSPEHFRGGEAIRVRNASPAGELVFDVPDRGFEVKTSVQGEQTLLEATIDTVLIEPDLERVIVLWKATHECPRKFLLIDYIRITEPESQP